MRLLLLLSRCSCLYDRKTASTLDKIRYMMFCSKVASGTTFIQVHSLPPTSSATKYHSLRTYLQVQQWTGNDTLVPGQWGWKIVDNQMVPPCTAHLPLFLPSFCALSAVIASVTVTKRCTCRKQGFDCSLACGECHGIHYSNSAQVTTAEEQH